MNPSGRAHPSGGIPLMFHASPEPTLITEYARTLDPRSGEVLGRGLRISYSPVRHLHNPPLPTHGQFSIHNSHPPAPQLPSTGSHNTHYTHPIIRAPDLWPTDCKPNERNRLISMPPSPISGRKPANPEETEDTSTKSSSTQSTTPVPGKSPVGRRKPVTDTDSERLAEDPETSSRSHSRSSSNTRSRRPSTGGVVYEIIEDPDPKTNTIPTVPTKGVISPRKPALTHDSQFPDQAYQRGMSKLAEDAAASSAQGGSSSGASGAGSGDESTTKSKNSNTDTHTDAAQAASDVVSEKDQRTVGATGVLMRTKDPPLKSPLGQSADTATGTTSKDTASITTTDTATGTTRHSGNRLAEQAFKDAQQRHFDRLDRDYQAGKSTCSIVRRKFAGDTETVAYENEERWKQIRKQWEKELIQPGWNWADIRKRQKKKQATYMPWDDGTRTRLFERDIEGTKFTYDTSRLGPSATTKSGWVSNHWTDMSVVDVQSSVLALLTDKERETFYENMDKPRRKKKIRMKIRKQRHEQAGNNVNNLLDKDQRKKVYDPRLSSLGEKGAMDMYSQIKQMSALGLMSERPDLTITSPLYRPFQTGCLTQGLTPTEIEEGKAPVMLAAPSFREQLSRSDVSRVHKTANILHSDWKTNMREGKWTDESTGVTKERKYMDPWKGRKRENDEDLALRIKDDWVPYMGIVADTLARTKENWDSDDEIELDVHAIMHHEILAMANKVLGIPKDVPGNEWQNGEMRPTEITFHTDGFAGQEGSTLSAQATKVWNPLYPRKHNLSGLDDLPKELDGHRDRQTLLQSLTRRMYTSIWDKFKSQRVV